MNSTLMRRIFCTGLLLIAIGGVPVALAQDENERPRPRQDTTQQADRADEGGSRMGGESPEMREMARAMKSMAELCQMMMQREMAFRPYWVTAAIVLGSLLVIALVLFIILEVQWIRFWSLRIKTERKNLA